jgi:hypothetical protein
LNAILDCTIAFLSLSWSKNIHGSPRLESGWINYDFQKIFYHGPVARSVWEHPGQFLWPRFDPKHVLQGFLTLFGIRPPPPYKYKVYDWLRCPRHTISAKINLLSFFTLFSHLLLLSFFVTAAWLEDVFTTAKL